MWLGQGVCKMLLRLSHLKPEEQHLCCNGLLLATEFLIQQKADTAVIDLFLQVLLEFSSEKDLKEVGKCYMVYQRSVLVILFIHV